MDIGSFGFLRVPSSVPIVEDQIAVLRLLGRLEYTLTPQIRHLIYRDTPERTMYRRLEELHKAGYIWRQAVSLAPKRRNSNAPPERVSEAQRLSQTPTKMPHVWGLTPEGKAYLEMTESEPEPQALAGLKTRDRRSPNVPLATLTHDLQASWWCSSVVAEATRNPLVTGIFVQIEFVTAKSQRVDALVGLRMNPRRTPRDMPGIPWYDGFGDGPGDHWRWFALEIDRGTEPLAVLLAKAVTYRDLTLSGVYAKLFSDPLAPVFIVPTPRRAGQIAQEWAHAWPDGHGVVSTPQQADHKEHGTLWGNYRHFTTGKQMRLLPYTLQDWKAAMETPSAVTVLPAPPPPALPEPAAAPATPAVATAPSSPAAAAQRPATPTPTAPTTPAPTTAPGAAQRPAAPAAAVTAQGSPAGPQATPARPAGPTPPTTNPAPAAPPTAASQRPQSGPTAAPAAAAPPRVAPPQAAPTNSAALRNLPPTPTAAPAPAPQAPAAAPATPGQAARPAAPPGGASAGSPSGATSGTAAAATPATEPARVRRRVVGVAAPKRQGNKG